MDDGLDDGLGPPPSFGPPRTEFQTDVPAPPTDGVQQPTPRSRKSVWVVAAFASAAVIAIVVLISLYVATANERDDNARALAESESNLAEAESNLAESEANLAESEATLADYRQASTDLVVLSLVTGAGVADDDATCMADAMLESLGPEALGLMADSVESDAGVMAFGAELLGAASDCGVTLDTLAPQTGATYGDNPEMDALYDECAAGDGASCDALYEQSGVGTEYETFGGTCGGRFEPAAAPALCEGSI